MNLDDDNMRALTTGFRIGRRMQGIGPSTIRRMLDVSTRAGMISFAGGLPAQEMFDTEALSEACVSVMRDQASTALQYGATAGPLSLRSQLTELMSSRGAPVDPSKMIVTTGAQQGLDIVSRTVLDPGDVVFVERPTYTTAVQTFRINEAHVRSVPSTNQGMDPDALSEMVATERAKGRQPRLLYVIPNFSNPAGWLVALERRRALLQIACREGLIIVEDDPYGDLYFNTPPPPSLFALAQHDTNTRDHVIYLGSLSKIVSPGIRVGWLVPPPDWIPTMTVAKQGADLQSSTLNQMIAAHYLSSGHLAKHLPVLRAGYSDRARIISTALQAHIPEKLISFEPPQGGMFIWVTIDPTCNVEVLVEEAIRRGVAFVPGTSFFADDPEPSTMRLTFATAKREQMVEGVRRLGAALVESQSTIGLTI